jgi:hypothetical protein
MPIPKREAYTIKNKLNDSIKVDIKTPVMLIVDPIMIQNVGP